jgi:hypothetical protein
LREGRRESGKKDRTTHIPNLVRPNQRKQNDLLVPALALVRRQHLDAREILLEVPREQLDLLAVWGDNADFGRGDAVSGEGGDGLKKGKRRVRREERGSGGE